jgi:signal transduction histidine kinase
LPLQFEYPPRARIEWVIAGARVVLAFGALLAAWLDPTMPAALDLLTYWLLSIYVVYSLAVFALVRNPVNFARGWGMAGHIFDLAAFAVFVFLTDGSTSPFFMYFVFSVMCAALRWESRGAILTAVAAVALYGAVSVCAMFAGAPFQLGRFVVRAIQLTVVGMLLTYLSSYHPRNLREVLRFASWPHRLPQDERDVVAEILEQAHDILPAPRLLLVWEEPDEEVVNLAWRDGAELQWVREPKSAYSPLVIPSLETASFHAHDVSEPAGQVDFWSARGFLRMNKAPVSEALRTRFGMRAVQSSRIDGDILQGRLFWLDNRRMRLDHLVVGELVARLSASRLDGAYLLAHFREAAALDERVRMARDLHDSLLQALAGTGLQLAVARRLLDREPETARRGLDEVQMQLEQHEMEMRSLIGRLRPIPREEIVPALGNLGQRLDAFRLRVETQWHVKVALELSSQIASLADDLSGQLYLIVQEAVLNAARHANATTIKASVQSDDRRVSIQVTDDGKGFPFVGSYDLATLNTLQSGPLTLKERVAELGGDLRINSGPTGADVRITVPFAHALS